MSIINGLKALNNAPLSGLSARISAKTNEIAELETRAAAVSAEVRTTSQAISDQVDFITTLELEKSTSIHGTRKWQSQ